MAVGKEFYEAASKDEALKAEAEEAVYGALAEFLKEKGLVEEAAKVVEAAVEKVAEAHGFASKRGTRIDLDELEAVAGGVCACVIGGGGSGSGKKCGCGIVGYGRNDSGDECVCAAGVGGGKDD